MKAGEEGVLQELPLQLGQWVVPGTVLAKVVDRSTLKAELRIAETQAQGRPGGPEARDRHPQRCGEGARSRGGPRGEPGHGSRGGVARGELPKGARPDLTVEGTVETGAAGQRAERGPARGCASQGTVSLFKLLPGAATQFGSRFSSGARRSIPSRSLGASPRATEWSSRT